MAQNGTSMPAPYENQDARISILANGNAPKGRIRFRRLFRASDANRLPTGRAIRCGRACEDFVEHPKPAPADGAVVDRVGQTVVGSCTAATQALMHHQAEATADPPTIDPQPSMRQRKIHLDRTHLL